MLEFGVEGLALLHGQLALLDKIVYDLLALFNGGRQSTDAGEKNLAQAVTKIKISHDYLPWVMVVPLYRTFFTPALNETGQSS